MKLNSRLLGCIKIKKRTICLAKAAIAFLLLSGCKPVSFRQAIITLDPNKTYQRMTGWEATAQAGQEDSAFSKYNQALFDQAADLGVNRLRVEIRAGAENDRDRWSEERAGKLVGDYSQLRYQIVNDNDDPFVINWAGFQFAELDYTIDNVVLPYKRRIEAKGERLFLNVNYVNFGKSNFQHYSSPQEYAEFVAATYLHLKQNYGLVPDAWEVVLEPDNNTSWTGKTIGEAIVAAAHRLIDQGFTPAFIVPSTKNAAKAPIFFDQIVEVQGAAQYIAEISYHRYRGATPDALRQIRERVLNFNLKSGMLEYIGADYRILHEDIKEGWVSSWQQYTLAFTGEDNGGKYFQIDNRNASLPVLVMGSRTKFLRQYFKYVRMDAVRIEAASDNSKVDPLAFRNSNGGFVVVVKTEGGGMLKFQGLPAGSYGITYTAGNEDSATLPDIRLEDGKALPASIPTTGVLTVFAR